MIPPQIPPFSRLVEKRYAIKARGQYEASLSGEAVYEYIFATPTTLRISTHSILSGELIDRVDITR